MGLIKGGEVGKYVLVGLGGVAVGLDGGDGGGGG